MKNPAHRACWALAAAVLAGCAPAGQNMTLPPPAVSVSAPLEREVTDYSTFTGHTAAVESVQVRARVWGYLQKINFKEGDEVKKDQVLFEIDPQTYQATLNQAEAVLKQAEAHRDTLSDIYARDRASPSATAQATLIQDQGNLAEAEAAVSSARASRDLCKLNVSYTKVTAPVSGRVSNAIVTVGNLVQSGDQAGGTLLTSIMSVDPMWVYFDVDDLTFLRVNPVLRKAASPNALPPVQLGLAGEDGYPHEGRIDFVDNQVSPGTGTIRMRGVFSNADRTLTPGLFARVRVPLGGKHKAVLVTDRAVDTDQGQKVVYVVGADNVAEKRLVELGGLHDGLREIKSGVKPGEHVIVDGIQWVRGGAPVNPTLVDMQTQAAEKAN
jgi:membrane fusion protein, multidrug efflux system